MHPTTSYRLLLLSFLALTAGGCDDTDSPLEPPAGGESAPLAEEPAALVSARWADAYVLTNDPITGSYIPGVGNTYNRSGGRITITRPAGTTGRYVATFSGLSSVLGARSTVHATAWGASNTFCKPMSGTVVSDKVEVRCFDSATGAPAYAIFSLVVLRKTATRAFAYAHLPTSTNYSPSAAGSWNPAGTTKVIRHGMGYYQVLFTNLGSQLSTRGGHVQVNAVASGKAHCKASEEWGGSPNLSVTVQCYTPAGHPVDAKFTVLFQLPAAHVGYAYANQPSTSNYAPEPFWSWHPTGGNISVERIRAGYFVVSWAGVDAEIIGFGNVQVTALGWNDYAQCKVHTQSEISAVVRCFAPNGISVDTYFTVLLGS